MMGDKIQQLRKSKGMSQDDLAQLITVSRQAISKWELNESTPDTNNVKQLCKIFSVSADYLLNDDIALEAMQRVEESSDHLAQTTETVTVKPNKRRKRLFIFFTVLTILAVAITTILLAIQRVDRDIISSYSYKLDHAVNFHASIIFIVLALISIGIFAFIIYLISLLVRSLRKYLRSS